MKFAALTLALIALAGCAVRNTLAQDLALERWEQCKGKFPTIALKEIRSDGEIWYWYQGAGDRAAVDDCLRDARRAQARGSTMSRPPINVAAAAPSGAAVTPDLFPANVPTWRPGFEWAYRYESPEGAGTYVRSVDRHERVDGVPYWVIKTGSREIFYRADDLALAYETVEGIIVIRHEPPRPNLAWPLASGMTWEQHFRTERPKDRQTNDYRRVWTAAPEEEVIVPAGIFKALKITERVTQTGRVVNEFWYSPEVMNWVKMREILTTGTRERELISYKIRP